jgi:radical SAM superfamily enzyme YgiQ (UPF0313 family)
MPRSLNPKQTYREYPLGIGYLGTILTSSGHEVLIHDQAAEGTTIEDIVLVASDFRPSVFGVSVITPNYPVTKDLLVLLKKEFPDTPIVAGGIHSSLFPEDLINDQVNFVVKGEAEDIIVELMEVIYSGSTPYHIPGLVFLRDGKLYYTKEGDKSLITKEIPLLNRSLFNLSLYTHHTILASRGCPYQCTFCCNYASTVSSNGHSIRDYKSVIEELKVLENDYNGKQVFFADDIFLAYRDNIISFCKGYIESRLSIEWIGQMRIDTIDYDLSMRMRDSGCKRIYFGVESGSPEILKRIKKGLTRESIISGIADVKASGIRVKTGWIYGLPGTIEEQKKSIDLMLETRPNEISIHQLIPFPGTEYYRNPSKYGIQFKDAKDFSSFCFGGVGNNITFDYMSQLEYDNLMSETIKRLEDQGYVSSDIANLDDEYIYSTPISGTSIAAFKGVNL